MVERGEEEEKKTLLEFLGLDSSYFEERQVRRQKITQRNSGVMEETRTKDKTFLFVEVKV